MGYYINTEPSGQYKVLRVNFRDVDDVVAITIDHKLFEYVSLVNIQQKYKPQS